MKSHNSYQAIQHETADQGGILILLYDGIIREIRRSKKAIANQKSPASHLLKAQMGVVELDRTLNFDANADLAESLHQVYLHCLYVLSDVLANNQAPPLTRIESLLLELRQAWAEAARANRQEKRAV